MDLVERVSRTATDLRQHDWRTDVEHGAVFGAVACGGLIMFFAPMKVSRVWDHGDGSGASWIVGWADWSAWVFLGATIALAALAGAALAERARPWFALVAAAIFLAVAVFSGDYWLDLRAEARQPIDYEFAGDEYEIVGAYASEFVAYLGGIGAFSCMTLARSWWWGVIRATTRRRCGRGGGR